MAVYMDVASEQWVGEYETRDSAGEVTRHTEWFNYESEARRFSLVGPRVPSGERVMVVINNYHGYWEYGVSAFLPWNTAQAVARRTAEAMLSYGDMGLGTWQARHMRKCVWNVPRDSGDRFAGDYYPNLWTGALSNMDARGNNRALNYRDRSKFVFVTTDGTNPIGIVQYWEASDDIIREEFGGER